MTAACDTSGTARLADIPLRLPFTSKHWNPHESRLLVLGLLFGLKGNPNMTRYKGNKARRLSSEISRTSLKWSFQRAALVSDLMQCTTFMPGTGSERGLD
jgi:hypothetical protein